MTQDRRIRGSAAYAAGIDAEARTVDDLARRGFVALACRCRTPCGEIDLVAASATLLLFVEVKRRRRLDDAAVSLRASQQRRLLAAGDYLLQTHPAWQREDTRFDLALHDDQGQIRWIEDILRLW